MKKPPFLKEKPLAFFSMIAVVTGILLLSSCTGTGSSKELSAADSLKGLKDFYIDYFPVGVAVSPRSLQGENGNSLRSILTV